MGGNRFWRQRSRLLGRAAAVTSAVVAAAGTTGAKDSTAARRRSRGGSRFPCPHAQRPAHTFGPGLAAVRYRGRHRVVQAFMPKEMSCTTPSTKNVGVARMWLRRPPSHVLADLLQVNVIVHFRGVARHVQAQIRWRSDTDPCPSDAPGSGTARRASAKIFPAPRPPPTPRPPCRAWGCASSSGKCRNMKRI